MSVNVNPPPQLRIPRAFIEDREVRAFFEAQRTILFQLWNRTGGEFDNVAAKQTIVIVSSDTVLDSSAYGKWILVEADTAAVQISLPPITGDTVGENVDIAILDATFDTTVVPVGGATVFGDTSAVMTQQFMSIQYTAASSAVWIGT